jgi:hypothetical protein
LENVNLEDREGSGRITLSFSWKTNYEGVSGFYDHVQIRTLAPILLIYQVLPSPSLLIFYCLTLTCMELAAESGKLKLARGKRKMFIMFGGYS